MAKRLEKLSYLTRENLLCPLKFSPTAESLHSHGWPPKYWHSVFLFVSFSFSATLLITFGVMAFSVSDPTARAYCLSWDADQAETYATLYFFELLDWFTAEEEERPWGFLLMEKALDD